jgi:hypothetical protein
MYGTLIIAYWTLFVAILAVFLEVYWGEHISSHLGYPDVMLWHKQRDYKAMIKTLKKQQENEKEEKKRRKMELESPGEIHTAASLTPAELGRHERAETDDGTMSRASTFTVSTPSGLRTRTFYPDKSERRQNLDAGSMDLMDMISQIDVGSHNVHNQHDMSHEETGKEEEADVPPPNWHDKNPTANFSRVSRSSRSSKNSTKSLSPPPKRYSMRG